MASIRSFVNFFNKGSKKVHNTEVPPHTIKPSGTRPKPNKMSTVKGKIKKGGAIVGMATGAALPFGYNLLKRNNIRTDPHIINTYNGTPNRVFNFETILLPNNAKHAEDIVKALLQLKSIMTGTQLGTDKTGLLISQDYVFTIEFGSKDPAKGEQLKKTLNKLLQLNHEENGETELNLKMCNINYMGQASALYGNGLPRDLSVALQFEEKRPLRMTSDIVETTDTSNSNGNEKISEPNIGLTEEELNYKYSQDENS
ncbi:hypothetical protein F352_116 [Campylobacter phage F352]|uniref:Uncharacterized protein n=4 Tax=Fletchervirus CPX TaxID=1110702 RepID=A0A7T3KHY2_9CAUD|nr:hypothetical protein F348_119 [Campylobacter phage F348]QPX63420.1 hypothetical protein F352_116 [Campylobacter phage F352]QPX65556.1 hypothetical protein F374_115 [Campylobacter phage F374]QPX65723.1 hypothetical protein F375_116 [Campylobacter phage F375]QXO05982.1 hypothetical protein [Campylobacter phage CJLB-10]